MSEISLFGFGDTVDPRPMTKDHAMRWLLVLGKDWHDISTIRAHKLNIKSLNDLRNGGWLDGGFIKDIDDYNIRVYRLSEKALTLLGTDNKGEVDD